MAAEHTAIGVQLVDDDEPQVLEQLRPARMVRQDPGVQHVGVAEDDVGLAANRAPGVRWRVAVVGEDANLEVVAARHQLRQRVQLGELILRQRLGREEIERAGGGVLQDRVQHGRVVAERLSGRGRGDRDDVPSRQDVGEGLRLVGVELLDAAGRERPNQAVVGAGRVRAELGRDRRQPADGGDDGVRLGATRASAST